MTAILVATPNTSTSSRWSFTNEAVSATDGLQLGAAMISAHSSKRAPVVPEPVESLSAGPRRNEDSSKTLFSQIVRNPDRGRISGLEKWEGRIVSIDGEYFTAELVAIGQNRPALLADFAIDTVINEPDRDEVQIGAQFYLTARTVVQGAKKSHTVILRLQKMGRWRQEELDAARSRADERAARLAKHFAKRTSS